MRREWAMPNPATFEIAPVKSLLSSVLCGAKVIVDPFARNSWVATHRNDLDPTTDAEYLYGRVGIAVGTEETQNGALYRRVRDALGRLLGIGGVAVSFGWNSCGFGKERGYRMDEILLVCHGGAHNDTIVVVETKMQGTFPERSEP